MECANEDLFGYKKHFHPVVVDNHLKNQWEKYFIRCFVHWIFMGHKCEVGLRLMGINDGSGMYIFNITKHMPTTS